MKADLAARRGEGDNMKDYEITCDTCPYYYMDADGNFDGYVHNYCHFVDRCPGDKAPCEESDENSYL